MLSIISRPRQALARHRKTRTRGQSMVEFALVLPIMLVLMAAAIDLGRVFYAYVAVENAAKEGALFGSRNPLCDDSTNINCGDPNNVAWHVHNEAPNLSPQLTATIACRDLAGALVQPINNCLDGMKYQVTVTYPFQLITPILSTMIGPNLTLHAESQATVISDAFDPSGLEVLVWASTTNSENGSTITTACTAADPITSPNFFYAPCQDALNVDQYLQYQEGSTISYKVRVRNTGNINLTSIVYGFSVNGTATAAPGTCGTLPTSMVKFAAPSYCTFNRTATDIGTGDNIVAMTASGDAQGLPTGQTNGAAVVKIIPKPKLAINLRASRYRLGGSGNGFSGVLNYPNGNMTLNRDTSSGINEIHDPTAWFYLSIVNQGGPANNFNAGVTQQGSPISLPASCAVPATLAASGQPGDSYACVFPRTLSATQAYAFVASASATNGVIVAGQQPAVNVTTATCGSTVVPNLVDTLTPSADGSNKTLNQARAMWNSAGFTGGSTSNPSTALGTLNAITQDQLAYTCLAANSAVVIGAQ
jgi:Flp pilus assembly protein TadG